MNRERPQTDFRIVSNRNLNSENRNAFTLIELLVVIAIISLLVSILLPSLQKTKQLARQVICLTRLRSIGSAYGLYLGDFDKGPVGFTYGFDEHAREGWSDYPKDAEGNPYNPYGPRFGWYKGRTTLDDGVTSCWALGEYLGVTGDRDTIVATCCPNWFDWFTDGIHTSAPTSYAVNNYLGREAPLGINIVKSTASTPMLMDGMGKDYDYGSGIKPYYTVFPRDNYMSNPNGGLEFTSMSETTHDNSANYLFFDGHAENHQATKDPSESLSYFNQLWTWYGD